MIRPPTGWSQGIAARALVWQAPGAELRYRERVAPVRRLAELVEDTRARVGAALAVTARDRLTTREGEHAAWAILEGDGLQVCVASVFGDSFCTHLELVTRDPARYPTDRALALELLRDTSLGLGVRRQRFYYRPPEGWEPLPSGLVTHWLAPGFPADPTQLVIFPANPSDATPESAFAALLADDEAGGLGVAQHDPPTPVRTPAGLVGKRWRYAGNTAGGWRHRELILVARRPYLYTLRLDAASAQRLEQHRPALLEVVESVEPVPSGGPGDDAVGDFFV